MQAKLNPRTFPAGTTSGQDCLTTALLFRAARQQNAQADPGSPRLYGAHVMSLICGPKATVARRHALRSKNAARVLSRRQRFARGRAAPRRDARHAHRLVATRDAFLFTRSHADSAERRYRAASTTERIKGTAFRVTTAATEENSQDPPLTEQTPKTARPLKSAIVRVCDIRRRRDWSGQDRATMRSVAEGGTCFIGASPATRRIMP